MYTDHAILGIMSVVPFGSKNTSAMTTTYMFVY